MKKVIQLVWYWKTAQNLSWKIRYKKKSRKQSWSDILLLSHTATDFQCDIDKKGLFGGRHSSVNLMCSILVPLGLYINQTKVVPNISRLISVAARIVHGTCYNLNQSGSGWKKLQQRSWLCNLGRWQTFKPPYKFLTTGQSIVWQ